MQRYFLEVAYLGTNYSGFQTQLNAPTIQDALEKALTTYYRRPVELTGSSRTDAGVHALQNFFHGDAGEGEFQDKHIYAINALLAKEIALKRFIPVNDKAHCRFDALYRKYEYRLHAERNPFLKDVSWIYPYPLDLEAMEQCASYLLEVSDFTSFSKRNTQARTMMCTLNQSFWRKTDDQLIYTVQANRFLRGMVRGLTGTMLQAGRGKISFADFTGIVKTRDCRFANFSPPGKGLFLMEVGFPEGLGID